MTIPDVARGYEEFAGTVGRTFADSRPAWPDERRPAPGSPNIVVVLVDDLGFSDLSPYGSEIHTPNVQRLADEGVQVVDYLTAPLCSPARAALLTGINPHRAGFAFPANLDPGYPPYAFELPDDAPTIAESLRDAGYATFAVGKWHLTRDGASHDAADRSSWPLQRGFDRYFGSLEGFTNLHSPHRLVWDNSPFELEGPDGTFLTDQITDRAISMIRSLRASDATKPFFLYVAHHAVHGPIQAKPEDLERYRGAYDAGWDHIGSERFRRQVSRGLFGPDVEASESDSDPQHAVVPWDDLTPEQQQRFARYMEVYAASVDNVDQNLGRLLDVIEQYGELDNTIVVFTADNGATAEGGEDGTRSYYSRFAHVPGLPADWDGDVDRELDLVGGPQTTVHYPRGWGRVSNTPFRRYKGTTHEGGVRAPLLVRWPAGGLRDGEGDDGLRRQLVAVTDLTPTLLDLAGIAPLTERHGRTALEVDGLSAAAVLRDPSTPGPRSTQISETGGHRGYVADGWKIVTGHVPGTPYDDEEWELYDLVNDPTESTDLAGKEPERVAELAAAWEREAWRNTVFPLVDPSPALALHRPSEDRLSDPVTLYPGTVTLERYRSSRLIHLRDVTITASIDFRHGDRGVLVAHGDQGGGYSVWIDDGALRLSYNAYGVVSRSAPLPLTPGAVTVRLDAVALAEFRWSLRLSVGDDAVALDAVPQLVGMAPFTGISVGADRGGPVDWDLWERERAFAYSGVLHHVRFDPGPPAPYDPRHVARLWADAARIFD